MGGDKMASEYAAKRKAEIKGKPGRPKGSGKKPHKIIKHYKTPLEPTFDDNTGLWCIKFEHKKGVVPDRLSGLFTSKVLAQAEIDIFIKKFQVEYI